MPRLDKITLGIKTLIGSFATIALMGAGYSDLNNKDDTLESDIDNIDTEIIRVDKSIDERKKEIGDIRLVMYKAITDIEVIKVSLRNQENLSREQIILSRNQENLSKEQVTLLREILKHQISNGRE